MDLGGIVRGGGQEILVCNSVYSTKRNSSTQVIFSCITLFSTTIDTRTVVAKTVACDNF